MTERLPDVFRDFCPECETDAALTQRWHEAETRARELRRARPAGDREAVEAQHESITLATRWARRWCCPAAHPREEL